MSVTYYLRIPAHDTVEEALAYCEARGLVAPRLHGMACPGVVGVGEASAVAAGRDDRHPDAAINGARAQNADQSNATEGAQRPAAHAAGAGPADGTGGAP